jgi:hypothetical protein
LEAENFDKTFSASSFNFSSKEKFRHILKETNNKIVLWLKRIGWVGFAFFLLKGLAWIAVWLGFSHYFEW